MERHDTDAINRLIGEFADLQERWENAPETFDWASLEALARKGANAYNEDAGPSFHALALDGVQHSEFHERFLAYSLQAGFDPFRLVRPGTGVAAIPVIDHASLAEAALSNPTSARMRAMLMELARKRFSPLLEVQENRQLEQASLATIEACAESLPLDLLEQIAPELARSHHGDIRKHAVDPVEGYLTAAEMMVENSHRPYG